MFPLSVVPCVQIARGTDCSPSYYLLKETLFSLVDIGFLTDGCHKIHAKFVLNPLEKRHSVRNKHKKPALSQAIIMRY